MTDLKDNEKALDRARKIVTPDTKDAAARKKIQKAYKAWRRKRSTDRHKAGLVPKD